MSRFTRSCLALCLVLLSLTARADEALDQLIDAVADAYGGAALAEIRNYRITERYLAPATGQSWSPELVEIGTLGQELIHDLAGNRLYFENWFGGRGGVFPTLVILDGGHARAINLQSGRYGDAASDDPYVLAGGTLRTTDTLLVRELLKARSEARYLGTVNYNNREHALVSMPFPQSPELTLYIDTETHLLSRMRRDNPQLGALDYVFSGHQRRNGITRATTTQFLVAGEPNLIGSQRTIEFNIDLAPSTFALPAGLQPEGERIVDTEMQVNRLAKNVYHIGNGGAYSIFVDTGSEVIASGGYAGLTQRFERFQQESGSHRPLRYQVITHHHQDHLGGVDEALALGATLVAAPTNVDAIRSASNSDPESGRILPIRQRMTLGEGEGRVEIYEVSTAHAYNYLLFYVPSVRALFMADHFNTPYRQGVPVANANTMSMAAALQPLDLGFRKIVTAHGARVYSSQDFEASIRAYQPYVCPANRPLCPQ